MKISRLAFVLGMIGFSTLSYGESYFSYLANRCNSISAYAYTKNRGMVQSTQYAGNPTYASINLGASTDLLKLLLPFPSNTGNLSYVYLRLELTFTHKTNIWGLYGDQFMVDSYWTNSTYASTPYGPAVYNEHKVYLDRYNYQDPNYPVFPQGNHYEWTLQNYRVPYEACSSRQGIIDEQNGFDCGVYNIPYQISQFRNTSDVTTYLASGYIPPYVTLHTAIMDPNQPQQEYWNQVAFPNLGGGCHLDTVLSNPPPYVR